MQNDFITLKEVLNWMDEGKPFSLTAITCDDKKQSGGEELIVAQAWKHDHLTYSQRKELRRSQPKTIAQQWMKNPNHYTNSTRNIRFENGEIRKVHIRLIRKFNDKTVL